MLKIIYILCIIKCKIKLKVNNEIGYNVFWMRESKGGMKWRMLLKFLIWRKGIIVEGRF